MVKLLPLLLLAGAGAAGAQKAKKATSQTLSCAVGAASIRMTLDFGGFSGGAYFNTKVPVGR